MKKVTHCANLTILTITIIDCIGIRLKLRWKDKDGLFHLSVNQYVRTIIFISSLLYFASLTTINKNV